MSDFDERWQQLVRCARAAPPHDAAPDDARLDRLALFARQAAARQRESGLAWPSLALAASVFLAALLGLGLGARSLGLAPSLDGTLTELARLPRQLPGTAWLPAPPEIPFVGTLAFGEASPARFFQDLDRILSPRGAAETRP